MGISKYLKELYKQPRSSLEGIYLERLQKFRKEPTTVRLDHPTRLDRARALGYKAKEGIFVVRQRVKRGGHVRPRADMKRRPKRMSIRLNLGLSYQRIAEMRAAKKYPNCEVLNSYWVAEDGKQRWYEIIFVDVTHPAIVADKSLSWITRPEHHGRAFRGLTSAGRKGRALHRKGKGAEKVRPSQAAHGRRLK